MGSKINRNSVALYQTTALNKKGHLTEGFMPP